MKYVIKIIRKLPFNLLKAVRIIFITISNRIMTQKGSKVGSSHNGEKTFFNLRFYQTYIF